MSHPLHRSRPPRSEDTPRPRRRAALPSAAGLALSGVLVLLTGAWFASGLQARDLLVLNFSRLLTTDGAWQIDPAISGDLIVFTDLRNGQEDLYVIDLSRDPVVEERLTETPEDEGQADIFDDVIVYTRVDRDSGRGQVMVTSIGGTARPVAPDPGSDQRGPAIGGNVVVWEDDRDGNGEIYGHDLLTGETKRLTFTIEAEEVEPSVSGCRVAYSRLSADGTCGVVVTDFRTLESFAIPHAQSATCYGRPDLGGNVLAYDGSPRPGNPDVLFYLFDEDAETLIELPAIQRNARVSGHWLSAEKVPLNPAIPSNVKIYNVPNLFPWELQFPDSNQTSNDIDGTRVAYVSDERGNKDIGLWTFEVDDNTHPQADAGPDQRVSCETPAGARVDLSAIGTIDAEGDPLVYTWTGPFPEGCGVVQGINPSVHLPLGRSVIRLVADDTMEPSPRARVEVRVVLKVEGLAPPLVTPGAFQHPSGRGRQVYRAGSAIPLRLRMSCGGSALGGADIAPPRVVALERSGQPVDLASLIHGPARSGGDGMEFRATGPAWTFVLPTRGLEAGDYTVTIGTPDGERHPAGFTLR